MNGQSVECGRSITGGKDDGAAVERKIGRGLIMLG
jgi:hypothetical protein